MPDNELKITLDMDRSQAAASARAFRAEQAALNASLLADATRTEAAKLAVQRDAQGRFVAGSKAATESVKQDFAAQSNAIGGAAKALGSFGAQMLGLDSAKAVLGAIVDHFEMARKSAYDASKMVLDYRENLSELAALKGKLGETSAAIGEDVAFRARTLQTAAAAREFQLAALGVGESAIGNAIGKGEFRRAMELGGAFQAVEGGSATAHGELTGLIPTLGGKDLTGEDVARKEAQLYKIMQPGGFSFTSGIGQFAKLAPLIKSGTYKDTEAAALLSAFSTSNREGAGENVEQFTRATVGMIGKKGRVTMEGGETLGKYFESLHIDEDLIKTTVSTRLPFEIGNRIAADISRQKAAAEGRGEEFSEFAYLKKMGYANMQDIGAVMAYGGLKKTGALDKTFLPLAAEGAMPTAAEAMAPIERAQAADPMMLARKAALAEQASQVAIGAGPEEYMASLKRTAFARLKARGDVTYGSYEDVRGLSDFGAGELLWGPKRKTDIEAQRMLFGEAQRLGIEVPGATIGRGQRQGMYMGDAALFELGRQIRARSGNLLPGAEDVTEAAQRRLGQSAAFERGEPGGGNGQVLERIAGGIDKLNQKPVQPPPPRPLVDAPRAARR